MIDMHGKRTENEEQRGTEDVRFFCSLSRQRGVSLVEILIYTGILVILMTIIVSTLLALSRSNITIGTAQRIGSAAEVSLERMVRDARSASSIDIAQSILGTSPGQLTLNSTDASGNATTTEFFLSGKTLRVKQGGTDIGPLTSTSTRVTELIFRRITTARSQAVKIEMTIESGTSSSYRSRSFYGTAVLRGSYSQ